ncbi:NUDIX hydrolase, partial [Patescibacteria group bacterium]
KKGKKMHYSVGALIEKDGKYLLIDRVNPPYGFSGIAGHIDENENETEALIREVKEESGLKVIKHSLLFEEEVDGNECHRGIKTHYWYVFNCDVVGEISQNEREVKSIGWYTKEQIRDLKLEPVWEYWFKKLKLI